jgi:hypothetical protein
MRISEIKEQLTNLENHYVCWKFCSRTFSRNWSGIVTKNFIDCGGKVRNETVVNFQLWNNDFEHRLKPKFIALSEKILGIVDFEIE